MGKITLALIRKAIHTQSKLNFLHIQSATCFGKYGHHYAVYKNKTKIIKVFSL